MSSSSPFISRLWILIPLGVFAFSAAMYSSRIRRVKEVTAIAQEEPAIVSASPTGYAGGTRELIVPEHITESYGWIAQTQHMLATGEWRIRTIDYENAPFGRNVHVASPYRWWLGFNAWLDHLLSGRPIGQSVERAALFADPLLHLLFLAFTTIFIARQFGAFSAVLYSLAGGLLYPFGAGFLPGAPDDFVLALVLAVASALPLLAGIKAARITPVKSAPGPANSSDGDPRRVRRWFLIAGIIGGLGLWINVSTEIALLGGVVLGALLAAWISRRSAQTDPASAMGALPWLTWGLGGSVTILVTYLVEYFPAHLGTMELRVIHPLYGLAWLGGSEILARVTARIQGVKTTETRVRAIIAWLLALVAVAALPVAMWKTENPGFLSVDLLSFRLTKQPDGVMAPNLPMWLSRDGLTGVAFATLLPLALLAVALWLVFRRGTATFARVALAVALGPVLVALVLAYIHLRNWQLVDGTLLILLTATTAAAGAGGLSVVKRWVWACGLFFLLLPGVIQLLPPKDNAGGKVLTLPEVEGLVERDLAHWLAKHVGPQNNAVVLAPPSVSSTLHYYGGLRTLASFDWANKDGLSVALRMVVSTSPEEAHALVTKRGVTHIVVPSWDPFFEQYTQSASVQTGELFLTGLHRWTQPSWLRPIPYQLPTIAGFEKQELMIFEVVDDQDDALALSRLTEYFIEMGQLESAKGAGQALKRFPADFGALVARAQLEVARGDAESFASVEEAMLKRLAAGADRTLVWDRRVSLATVLVRAKQMDKAKVQAQRCLAEVDEVRLRSLTTYSLYHLLGLAKAFNLQITDPRLRELARELLPADLRSRL